MPTKNDKSKVADAEKEAERKPFAQQLGKYAKRAKEKVHDMDTMLAQLVLLDTALEEKKEKSIRTSKTSKPSTKRDDIKKGNQNKVKIDSNPSPSMKFFLFFIISDFAVPRMVRILCVVKKSKSIRGLLFHAW